MVMQEGVNGLCNDMGWRKWVLGESSWKRQVLAHGKLPTGRIGCTQQNTAQMWGREVMPGIYGEIEVLVSSLDISTGEAA